MTISKESDISCNFLKECIEYDSETGLIRWKHRPSTHFSTHAAHNHFNSYHAGRLWPLKNKSGYVKAQIHGVDISAQRAAWCLTTGSWPHGFINHKDGVRDNNVFENLIEIMHSEDMNKSNLSKANKSGHVGVRFDNDRKRKNKPWRASLKIKGKTIALGSFASKQEAIDARSEGEKTHKVYKDFRLRGNRQNSFNTNPALESTLTSLADFVEQQVTFSREAFGPNTRTKGVIDHIKKELIEVEESDGSINEWVDVALLALDGMQRAATKFNEDRGVEATPALVALDVCGCLQAKLHKNINRDWPDWRTADPEKAIEHVRS